jgi:hypothetical protein
MSSHVLFLRDETDLQYQKFLRVLLSCQEAGIDPPKDVDDYFGYGVDNDPETPLQVPFKPREWSDGNMSEGFEIDVDEIPSGVKTIRFINSW